MILNTTAGAMRPLSITKPTKRGRLLISHSQATAAAVSAAAATVATTTSAPSNSFHSLRASTVTATEALAARVLQARQ